MDFYRKVTSLIPRNVIRICVCFTLLWLIAIPFIRRKYLYQGQPLTEANYTLKDLKKDNLNLVFYKPGCPYCEAAQKSVVTTARNSKYKTYFVNVTKERGIEISRQYHVTRAATIVTIRNKRLKYYRAAKAIKGHIVVDRKQIATAFK